MRYLSRWVAVVILILWLPAFAYGFGEAKPGNPDWHISGFYRIYWWDSADNNNNEYDEGDGSFIKRGDKVVSILEKYELYRDGRYKKKKLKLFSKLGFSLENIPKEGENSVYFYNEAIATFLEAEELLPKAKEWLEENGHESCSLEGLRFHWPDKPKIDEKTGQTYYNVSFPRFQWYWNLVDGKLEGRWHWVDTASGTYYSKERIIITYGYKRTISIVIHEYLHACGYQHQDEVFKLGDKRSTYTNPD